MLDLAKNLIERRMIELDRDLAKHYSGFNTYETQRTLRPGHVSELSKKMENGLFRFGEIGFAVMNGTRDIMINGQHVCAAVEKSGKTVPCILERFRINNDRELSEAFRQFEILPRSLQDMVKVEAHSLKLPWPLWLSSLLVSVAVLEVAGQRKMGGPASIGSVTATKYLSRDDRVRLLGRYLKEGEFLASIFCLGKREHSRHLQKKAVALIMVKSYRTDEYEAHDFWEMVRDGENLTRDMPEMKLREFLLKNKTFNTLAYNARRISDHEFAYRCVQAWNAFRQGTKTKLTYYSEKVVPNLK